MRRSLRATRTRVISALRFLGDCVPRNNSIRRARVLSVLLRHQRGGLNACTRDKCWKVFLTFCRSKKATGGTRDRTSGTTLLLEPHKLVREKQKRRRRRRKKRRRGNWNHYGARECKTLAAGQHMTSGSQ